MTAKAKFRIEGEDATAAAFRSALGNAQVTANRMGTLFRAAFAGISVSAIAGVAMRSIELGDTLAKMSVKAGIGGQAISELAFAAKMADVDMAGLANAIRYMQKTQSEAQTGLETYARAYRALGVDLKQFRTLAADRQFELIADRISKMEDAADRARAATEIFGRAGADLLPLFEEGAAGIRKAREEAQRLGQSFTDEQIQKLAEADEAVKRLRFSWEAFATALTSKAAPAISGVLDLLRGELPKQDIATQIAYIQYQMDMLEGTKVERGLRKLDELRGKLLQLQNQQTPYEDFAARRSRAMNAAEIVGAPVGYAASDEAEKAAEARLQAEKEAAKRREELYRQERNEFLEIQRGIQSDLESALEDGDARAALMFDNALVDIDAFGDQWRQHNEEMVRVAEARDAAIKDIFDEGIFRAWEDGLDGMLKYWTDTLAQIAIQTAATNLFNFAGGSGGWFGKLFGGFMAEGGPLQQGKWYVAGEKGPEPIWGGGPGAFAAGYGKGSGGGTPIEINIDARGAQDGVAKQLAMVIPAVVREAVNQSRAAVMGDLNRRGLAF